MQAMQMNYFGGLREVLLFHVKSKTEASDSSTLYYVVKEIVSMVHPHMVEMFDPSKNHISLVVEMDLKCLLYSIIGSAE